MRKLFMALMAVAAISFVGCKPQNTPEEPKSEMKLFYEVKLTGNVTDYVKLNMRYVNIPDSNDILVKENIVAEREYDEYTVQKEVVTTCGVEPSVRVTELFKQLFTDQAKYNTMVTSNPKLFIAMGYKITLPDGSLKTEYINKDSVELATLVYAPQQMNLTIYMVEKNVAQPIAATILWDGQDKVNTDYITNFWNRH